MLEYNHSHLNNNFIRRRKISNSLKRKAQENLHGKPAKLHRSQLEPKDLKVLTTQNINSIHKFVKNPYQNYLISTEEVQDSFDKIDIKILAGDIFLFLNGKASNIVIITCNTNLNIIKENWCIYVDGTFEYCPKMCNQMFTTHVLHNGHYLPFF
jgi:hypothetical protein